jgi:uncharacterized membrane protein YgdD (TMEM256/DUF423 family)
MLLLASLFGLTAVALGAFGAHILKRILTPEDVQIFETGVRYQFYHTFALLVVAMLSRYVGQRWTGISAWLFVVGIVFFSGSLYMLALLDAFGFSESKAIFGPLTPIGGLLFMGGWLAMFRAAFDYKKSGHSKSSSSSK